MQELNNKVLDWAKDKGILDNSDPLKQLKKTFEEVAELICALIDKAETKDAIGDVNVTLIILKKLAEAKQVDGDLANSRVFMAINWIVEIFSKVTKNKDVGLDIIRAQEMLNRVSQENGLTLEECTLSAYEVISKRTGKMENGMFVKDSEPVIEVGPVKPKTVCKTKKSVE